MAYLQLAEDSNMLSANPMEHYILVPPGFLNNKETMYVREDYFDTMNPEQYKTLMLQLAPYQTQTMSEGELANVASFAAGFIPGVGPIASKAVKVVGNLVQRRKQRIASGEVQKGAGLKGLFKKKPGAGAAPEPTTKGATIPPIDISGSVAGQSFDVSTEKKTGWWANQSKTTKGLIIGGGAAVVLGGAYLLLRKKKRR